MKNQSRGKMSIAWLMVALCFSMIAILYNVVSTPMSLFASILNGWAMVALTIVCCEVCSGAFAKDNMQEEEIFEKKAAA